MARKRKEEDIPEIEPDKRFKLKLSLKSGVAGVDSYIEEVRSHFLEFNVTEISRLIESLDHLSTSVVERLFAITNMEDVTIPTLDEAKTEEVFAKLMQIVDRSKEVVRLCGESMEIIQEVDDSIDEEKEKMPEHKPVIKPTINIFEQTLEKSKRGKR